MTTADLMANVKKQPVGFGCGLVCLALGVLLYFRSSTIDEKQVEFDTKSAEATKIISNVSLSKNLPEQVQEIQTQVKEVENRLVRAGQLAVNLQYFYKLEAENQVKLLDVRQNNFVKAAAGTYGAVPYNVSIQGSFTQVMAFLNRLENGPHFCRFSSAVFGKATGGDGAVANGTTLTMNIEILGQP